MAMPETQSHLPAIAEHERKEAGHLLQSTLVELIALSLIGKQLHWSIVGHGFRDLHLQLDELVDEWQVLSDLVAERAVAIGYPVDGRAPAVVEQSELQPVDGGPTEVPKAIREIDERLAASMSASAIASSG
jgi:starvation-inducible DNA-binding protein